MTAEARRQVGQAATSAGILLVALPLVISLSFGEQGDLADLELYKISWNGPLNTQEKFSDDVFIRVANQNKEQYQCVVPDSLEPPNFDASATNASSSSSSAPDGRDKTPHQILEPLVSSNFCSYRSEPYWIYELCHGRFLRQYHEESGKFKSKVTQEYFLGRMEPEQLESHEDAYEQERLELQRRGQSQGQSQSQSRPTVLVNGHHKPYVQFNMTGGTKCDLTKQSRLARVVYVCNEEPKHELYSVKEVSTCEYEAIVLSPLLCQHKDFKVDTVTQREINCYSLDGAPRRLANSVDPDEEEVKYVNRKTSYGYFDGRTIIIDADLFNHQMD